MTFQELARNIYEAAQFDRPANQRTVWDNETLAVKLRYQRAAKVALDIPYISAGDVRDAIRTTYNVLTNVDAPPHSDAVKWLASGFNMPALVHAEIGRAIAAKMEG